MISQFKVSQLLQLIIFLLLVNLSWGQRQNPFELQHRLDKVDPAPTVDSSVAEIKPEETSKIEIDSITELPSEKDTQPTRMIREDSLQLVFNDPIPKSADSFLDLNEDPIPEKTREKEKQEVLELPQVLQSRRNLIFSTFIILTLFLTVVISFNRAVVNKVMRSILNDNYLNLLYREQKGRWSMQFLFLYIFFIANLALLLFLMDDKWEMDKINANLLYLCGLIALIYFSRHCSLNVLGNAFPISKETGQFSFTIMLFNIFLGLLLLPVNLFIAFAPDAIADTFIYIGLGIVFMFYVLRQLRGLFIGARFILNSKFHFLLYLCTVEIAPMAVLYKFFQPFFN